MARVLYAWEIGGGLGHFTNMQPTASRLQADGHDVHMVVRHLNHAESILGEAGLAYSQAPIWQESAPGLNPANYAEMLMGCGYREVAGLVALLRAWRQTFAHHKPDLLVADHAPTALLAARGLGIRTALIGNGFFSPPRLHPMPIFRTWEAVDAQRVTINEQQIVGTINAALAKVTAPPINTLSDIFASLDVDLLCTWPEMDAYPQRGPAAYYGPLFTQEMGHDPQWPTTAGKRILLYLKAQYPHLPTLLEGLRASKLQGAAYIAGGIPPARQRVWPANIQLLTKPIHLRHALMDADALVCHAGSTIFPALLAGKPLLLLPMQAEQFITAQCASKIGAALTVVPELKPVNWAGVLHEITHTQCYTDSAKAFAAKYADFNQAKQTETMAAQLEMLL